MDTKIDGWVVLTVAAPPGSDYHRPGALAHVSDFMATLAAFFESDFDGVPLVDSDGHWTVRCMGLVSLAKLALVRHFGLTIIAETRHPQVVAAKVGDGRSDVLAELAARSAALREAAAFIEEGNGRFPGESLTYRVRVQLVEDLRQLAEAERTNGVDWDAVRRAAG